MKKYYYYLFILGFIWGTSFLFQKVLTPVFGAALTSGVRLFVGGLFLCMIAVVNKDKIFKREYIQHLVVYGVVNGAIPFTLFSLSSLFIPSTFSVLVNSMTPMMTALMAFLILKERLTKIQAIGLGLGMSGIAISTLQGGVVLNSGTFIGILFCFTAIFCYACSFVYYRRFHVSLPSTVLGGGSQVIGGVILLLISIFWHPQTIHVTIENTTLLLVFSVFCSGVAYYLFYEVQKNMSPLETSLVTLIVPIFGVTLGVLILHEPLTLGFIIGSLITLIGVYFVIFLSKRYAK